MALVKNNKGLKEIRTAWLGAGLMVHSFCMARLGRSGWSPCKAPYRSLWKQS